MSDFVAQIQAVLDTSKAEAQLKDLEKNQKIKLDVDDSKIEEAQKKLKDISKDNSKVKLDVDVNAKSVKKGIDETLEETKKQAKKKPIEVDYKVSKNTISQLTDNANRLFSLFSGGNNALDASIDKVREAIGQLKELNTALVEIDKTSNLTQTSLQSLANKSFDEASKFGAYVQDYMNSAGEFAKAGYSNLDEITETAMLTQIAGNVTSDLANKYIIATDAAYKYNGAINDLTKVIDGSNNIANKNSVEVEDLAKAATVSASFAAQAGVTIDQLTAAEGTMSAVTKRSGSEMGRAFRSILLNLQQVSGEFDGEVIDEEQLKKVEERCHSLGVELEYMKDGVATLRNPMEVLKDLSEVYRSLPDNSADKQGLISDIGGKYHANALSSLLGNWELYEKMLQDFASGEGSAMREALKTADSWEGRLNSLSNSWLEFVNNFVQADTMKGGISFLDNMISAFDTLQDKQLFIPTMISSIMGLRNLFTGKGITDIGFNKDGKGLDIKGDFFGIKFGTNWKKHFSEAESEIERWNHEVSSGQISLDDFGGKLVEQNKNFKDYISGLDGASGSLDGYKEHLKSTGVEFEKAFNPKSFLTNALTGLLVGTGVELSLVALTKLADELIYKQDHLQEKVDSSATAYSSTVSEIESINSELATTQSRIDELRSQDKLLPGDEAELAELERKNSLLETQLNTKKQLADTQAIEAAEAAKESINYASKKSLDTHMDKNGMDVSKSINRKEYIKELVAEMEEAQKRIDDAQDKLADDKLSKKNRKLYEGQFDSARESLEKYKSEATELLAELNAESENFYDKQTGEILKGFEKEVKENLELNDLVNGFDLSPIEKQVKQIESYFNGSKTSNAIKDQLLEAAKSGKSATDALHEMGITLNDLGITGDDKKAVFDDYFSGLVQSAEEAQNAINSIDGSVDGVKKAFESENKDADWNSMAEFAKQANELYEQGKVGTDDFKSFVQFMSPDIINPDAEEFKYDADAYVAAWENAREKVKRYFDSENPITSATNFTNDLIDRGLASKAGDDITWGFKNSAEAAKELDISVEATEVAMRNLESYGAEFDDVMFSGEGLKRYETALDGIKSLRDSMEEGNAKEKLSDLIGNWDNELAGYQADLSTLTEDQIVKIEFQYDLASIRSEIEELQNSIDSTGGDTKEWGSLNSKKISLRDKLSSQDGMSGATDNKGYTDSLSAFDNLAQKLISEYDTLGEEGRRSIQQQQSALLDLQNSYLDMFQNGNITDWESFLNTNEANDIFDKLAKDTNRSVDSIKKELSELANVTPETKETGDANEEVNNGTKEVNIKANDEASDTITSVLAELMRLPEEEVSKLIADDNASDKVINVLSSLSGIPEEKLTEINATDGATAVVTYALSQILGIPEEKMTELLATDKASNIAGKVRDSINKIPKKHDSRLAAIDNASPIARNVSSTINSIKDKTVTISAVVSGTVNSAVNTVRAAMASLGGASLGGSTRVNGTLLPARANGTGYNVLSYRPAYSDGKISLSQDEQALVNELGIQNAPMCMYA